MLQERVARWKKEWRQQGREKGFQKGKELLLLPTLLQNKFGEIPAQYRAKLEDADGWLMLYLAERLPQACSLEALFSEVLSGALIIFNRSFLVERDLKVHIKREFIHKGLLKRPDLLRIKNLSFLHFGCDNEKEEDPLLLPKYYAILSHLVGPSELRGDNYGGAYYFMFSLGLQTKDRVVDYLYNIRHDCANMDFSASHMIRKTITQDIPSLDEFDLLPDMISLSHFTEYFCGYLLGYLEGSQYTPKPFVHGSGSNLLLFGYYDNNYFFKHFKNDRQYRDEKQKFAAKIGHLNIISRN